MYSKQTIRLAVAAFIAAMALAACEPGDPGRSTGAYPIDIFQEMHYSQSSKAQEPPRFFPPAGSIPVTGGFVPAPPARSDVARELVNPLPQDALTTELGALLYRQNCSMCHGTQARGQDGYVGARMVAHGMPTAPPDFDSERIVDLSEGEVFASISNGFAFMPAFQSLLAEEDRWALARIATLSPGDRQAALAAANAFPDTDGDGNSEPERTLRLLELRELVN